MQEITKTISKIMDTTHKSIRQILTNQFPNLCFYISPTGELSLWTKTPNGESGAKINIGHKINVGQILYHQLNYLDELNNLIEPVVKYPNKYFYCTECRKIKPKLEFEDSVFAGYYCKDCAKKPEIKALIQASHKKGFYD